MRIGVGAVMGRFLWICLAGALGTGARYLLSNWVNQRWVTVLPLGTLLVNAVGCFLGGAAVQLVSSMANFPVTLRLVLTTGFLGGFTTYSAFNAESTRLIADGGYRWALLNTGLTFGACYWAGLLGQLLARRVLSS